MLTVNLVKFLKNEDFILEYLTEKIQVEETPIGVKFTRLATTRTRVKNFKNRIKTLGKTINLVEYI